MKESEYMGNSKKDVLYFELKKRTSTVWLMDEFDSLDENGDYKYNKLVLFNLNLCKYGYYSCHIERYHYNGSARSIKMQDFKKGEVYLLNKYVEEQIEKWLTNHEKKSRTIIHFDEPFILKAQNSLDRSGYGNIYHGDELVYEGTKYGQTTSYAITEIEVTSFI